MCTYQTGSTAMRVEGRTHLKIKNILFHTTIPTSKNIIENRNCNSLSRSRIDSKPISKHIPSEGIAIPFSVNTQFEAKTPRHPLRSAENAAHSRVERYRIRIVVVFHERSSPSFLLLLLFFFSKKKKKARNDVTERSSRSHPAFSILENEKEEEEYRENAVWHGH